MIWTDKVSSDPYGEIKWTRRDAVIVDSAGASVFEQKDVEVPQFWSDQATRVVASKYFRLLPDNHTREYSVRQLIKRVVDTVTAWGRVDGHFDNETQEQTFNTQLAYLLLHQYAAFNSPVWFNVGIGTHPPQCSACFINSVHDTMESILELCKTEGLLFKHGSGTGTNFSPLRSRHEALSVGGMASGPVSFMRGFDAFAGVIKSGGTTRRAAKMVILDADHPDIVEFIECKAREEKKAWVLIDAGYDAALDGEAYGSVFFQNSNLSVRASDEFMRAALSHGAWKTHYRTSGAVADSLDAHEVLTKIAQASHLCGDPGMQFATTINRWHTCKASGDIVASNPCSEYMFLDDTACNLASLNLLKFLDDAGRFDIDGFKQAIDVVFKAQEILIDHASYPTPKIATNSRRFRPLGLGYSNLGAFLMVLGMPYDSAPARATAAAITALLTGQAYRCSAEMAARHGAFEAYATNQKSMLDVMQLHQQAAMQLSETAAAADIVLAAQDTWNDVVFLGRQSGFRNAQATVLAPTGTISFMMDCDTTGIEPDLALIKIKTMVGGGVLKMVNSHVATSLQRLGYSQAASADILRYLEQHETLTGAPHLKIQHLPVFDCALKSAANGRVIAPSGHLAMMAAVQPFLSGAISKTVNLPNDASVEDVVAIYVQAWELGLKAIAIYRDGCKRSQPLSASSCDVAHCAVCG